MSRIAYVNGRYLPHREASVNIDDRGYQFADGVYEVIAIERGRLVDEGLHLRRLGRSLAELEIVEPMPEASLKTIMREVTRRNRVRDGIAGVLSDLSESLSGVRVVTGFNRARHNVLQHRNVTGVYRDANDHTAHLAATYGACTEFWGLLGQAAFVQLYAHLALTGSGAGASPSPPRAAAPTGPGSTGAPADRGRARRGPRTRPGRAVRSAPPSRTSR